MPDYERIYITGFMGSGKSTVTPRLARCLDYKHLDLDAEISKFLGMSIPAIFDVLGEDRFRETESSILRDSRSLQQHVISLGGGSVTREENLKFCLDNGLLVYLRASARFLSQRLSRSIRNRPMLFGADGTMLEGAELEERVEHLLSTRSGSYEQAHIVVHVDDKSPSEITEAVCSAVRKQQ